MSTPAPVAPVPPRVLRRRSGRVVAGVAGGVADHLDVPVLRVRLAFVLLAALSGAGFVAYGALWIFCVLEPEGTARVVEPRERRQGVGLAAVGLGIALALSALGEQVGDAVVGPLGLALVGVAVVWREADGDPSRPRRGTGRPSLVTGRAGVARVVAGALLVVGGVVAFLFTRLDLGQVPFALLAVLASVVGVVVLTVPWWVRLARELTAERRERIRGQERAEIAAHLHDSVLQTLALIQRRTEESDPDTVREVRRLARRQERELRAWLYDAGRAVDAPEKGGPAPSTFGEALRAAAASVEDTHAVRVTPVLVGGCDQIALDDAVGALVAAAREAMVNAAKHAGVDEVSVYAEAGTDEEAGTGDEPGELWVFVRDRGRGFDPDTVDPDRHGLADSVRARTARHGGSARVRSAPGEGTEVTLHLPRAPRPSTSQRPSTQEAS